MFKLSWMIAFLYWCHCNKDTLSAPVVLLKVASTFLLACHSMHKSPEKKALNASLMAHCTGDLIIETHNITYSIPFFLIGHLCYLTHLSAQRKSLHELSRREKMGFMGLIVVSGLITHHIASTVSGAMRYAVPLYAFALFSIFLLSSLQKNSRNHLVLCALSYIASDLMVVINAHIKRIPNVGLMTWPTYFCAQAAVVGLNTKKTASCVL